MEIRLYCNMFSYPVPAEHRVRPGWCVHQLGKIDVGLAGISLHPPPRRRSSFVPPDTACTRVSLLPVFVDKLPRGRKYGGKISDDGMNEKIPPYSVYAHTANGGDVLGPSIQLSVNKFRSVKSVETKKKSSKHYYACRPNTRAKPEQIIICICI